MTGLPADHPVGSAPSLIPVRQRPCAIGWSSDNGKTRQCQDSSVCISFGRETPVEAIERQPLTIGANATSGLTRGLRRMKALMTMTIIVMTTLTENGNLTPGLMTIVFKSGGQRVLSGFLWPLRRTATAWQARLARPALGLELLPLGERQ